MYHGRSFLWSAGWCMLVGIWKAIRRYKFCNGSCCCYHYPSTVIVRYSFKICTFPLPIRVDSIVIVAAAADALCLLIQAYFDCRLLLCSFNSIYVCLSFCLFQCFPFFSSNEIFTEFCSSFTAQSCIELLDYCFEHTHVIRYLARGLYIFRQFHFDSHRSLWRATYALTRNGYCLQSHSQNLYSL